MEGSLNSVRKRLREADKYISEVGVGNGNVIEDVKEVKLYGVKEIRRAVVCSRTLTCIAVGEKKVFCGSKDRNIYALNQEDDQIKCFKGHKAEVWTVALHKGGKLLASGGKERIILLWNTSESNDGEETLLQRLGGHRDSVTGLAFCRDNLISCSKDRTLRIYAVDASQANTNKLVFVDEVYGHQSAVLALASTPKFDEQQLRAVTISQDFTVRLWKLNEDSNLLFPQFHKDVFADICMVDSQSFITADINGVMAFWHSSKKKPIHHVNTDLKINCITFCRDANILVVGATTYTTQELFPSKKAQTIIQLWEIDPQAHMFVKSKSQFTLAGIVNAMHVKQNNDKVFLTVCIGSDCRLGRWDVSQGLKGTISVMTL